MLFFVKLSKREMLGLKKKSFSDTEYFSNITRYIKWITLNKYMELLKEKKIHCRLLNKHVIAYLKSLDDIININNTTILSTN